MGIGFERSDFKFDTGTHSCTPIWYHWSYEPFNLIIILGRSSSVSCVSKICCSSTDNCLNKNDILISEKAIFTVLLFDQKLVSIYCYYQLIHLILSSMATVMNRELICKSYYQ